VLKLTLTLIVALSSYGCGPRLSVSGDSNPEFKVGGLSVLYFFGIEEIDPQMEQRIGDYDIWGFGKKVEVQSLPMMWRLPAFRYHSLPSNDYKQIYPYDSVPPHPLEEGKFYRAEIHTPNKDHVEVVFQIKSGKVTVIKTTYK